MPRPLPLSLCRYGVPNRKSRKRGVGHETLTRNVEREMRNGGRSSALESAKTNQNNQIIKRVIALVEGVYWRMSGQSLD